MKYAFLFPGQGSQYIGMGKELYHSFQEARDVFEEVDEVLKQNLTKLIFSGEASELTNTENAQPAIMAVSMAVFKVLEKQGGFKVQEKCAYAAGHSLGEYSALCATQSLTIRDTASLLKTRGQEMSAAGKRSLGAMIALLGATITEAKKIVEAASVFGICQIANDNGSGQIVLSGDVSAIDQVATISANYGVKKAIKLSVSGAFHSQLMRSAEEEMHIALSKVTIHEPLVPIIANVTASEVTDPKEISELLIKQITGTVRWRESMEYMINSGVNCFVEVGPGKVLSTIAKRMAENLKIVNIILPEDLESFLKSF
jgi:[acyl-carrier-protein] S-malonyltransferase